MVTVKTRATIEDLYRASGKAELVNGEIVPMAPTGDDPGRAGDFIFVSLFQYGRGPDTVGRTATTRDSASIFRTVSRSAPMPRSTPVRAPE